MARQRTGATEQTVSRKRYSASRAEGQGARARRAWVLVFWQAHVVRSLFLSTDFAGDGGRPVLSGAEPLSDVATDGVSTPRALASSADKMAIGSASAPPMGSPFAACARSEASDGRAMEELHAGCLRADNWGRFAGDADRVAGVGEGGPEAAAPSCIDCSPNLSDLFNSESCGKEGALSFGPRSSARLCPRGPPTGHGAPPLVAQETHSLSRRRSGTGWRPRELQTSARRRSVARGDG